MRREPETNKKQRKISTMKPINNKQKKKPIPDIGQRHENYKKKIYQ